MASLPRNTDGVASCWQCRDIKLAAALISEEGVEFDTPALQRFSENGQEFCVFRFKDSPKLKDLAAKWDDEEWLSANPAHWLAYVKAYAHNHGKILDHIRKVPVCQIKRDGKKIYLVPVTAP